MLYNLNLYNVKYQLYFDKVGEKRRSGDLLADVEMASVLKSFSLIVKFCSASFRYCDLDPLFTFSETQFSFLTLEMEIAILTSSYCFLGVVNIAKM